MPLNLTLSNLPCSNQTESCAPKPEQSAVLQRLPPTRSAVATAAELECK
jgi:hypothetical protein